MPLAPPLLSLLLLQLLLLLAACCLLLAACQSLLYCAVLLMRLAPGALLWLSPQCSSWLSFFTCWSTKRSRANPLGDESATGVREGNIVALVMSGT